MLASITPAVRADLHVAQAATWAGFADIDSIHRTGTHVTALVVDRVIHSRSDNPAGVRLYTVPCLPFGSRTAQRLFSWREVQSHVDALTLTHPSEGDFNPWSVQTPSYTLVARRVAELELRALIGALRGFLGTVQLGMFAPVAVLAPHVPARIARAVHTCDTTLVLNGLQRRSIMLRCDHHGVAVTNVR